MKFRILIYGLVFLPLFSFGQPKDSINASIFPVPEGIEILNIDSNDPSFLKGRYDLTTYLYCLVDSTGELNFSESSSSDYAHLFVPFSEVSLLDLSMGRQEYWLRLTVRSGLGHEVVWLTNFMEAEVESYVFAKNGNIERRRSGILVPASERHFKKRYGHLPLLPIVLPEAGYKDYYWRITTDQVNAETDTGKEMNRTLLAPSFISNYRSVSGFIIALYLGFALAVGLYHLVIFFYIREWSYLWFALYCFSCLLASMTMSGYALQFLWPELPMLHYVLFRGLTLFVMFLILIMFTRSYLQTARLTPVWDKILLTLLGLLVFGNGLRLLNIFSPQVNILLVRLGPIILILLTIAVFITAVQCLRKGYRPAKLYLLASVAFLFGMILNILTVKEVLPLITYFNWVVFGRVVQLILFSLGLAQLFKSLLDEKLEAERLKELDHVKTRLYTNITHEFRTPITVILGMAEQVRDNPKDWFREGLRMITRNGKNLLNLVNQMLDLSKLETESLPVNMVRGDVVNYLQYIIESFHSYAETKGVRLHFLSKEKALSMDYDPEKLLNIVSNLLSNAIKYTPEGGDVYVYASVNLAGASPTNPTKENLPLPGVKITKVLKTPEVMELRVRDTGIGIPEDKLPFIFDRFYQVEDDAMRNRGGTGIGLALTKELVKLLGGNINIKSTPGEGSEFSVSLPIRRTAQPEESMDHFLSKKEFQPYSGASSEEMIAESTTEAQEEKPLLLIIEDNRDVVRYLSACLKDDYRLAVAYDGKSGIGRALELVPDIVVSDVMMPEADGFEVCQVLKKDLLTSHVPIILLTAKADVTSKIEGFERGADAYMAKPFHKGELLVRLRKLIELRKNLQEHYRTIPLPETSTNQEMAVENAFIREVQNTLEAHLDDEHFGISELYKALGVSRAQLYRKFKALTGQSIGHYFRSLRLHKANTLLKTTSLNITEIAFEAGFKDPAYFTRTFKEEFGKNPSQVRG